MPCSRVDRVNRCFVLLPTDDEVVQMLLEESELQVLRRCGAFFSCVLLSELAELLVLEDLLCLLGEIVT